MTRILTRGKFFTIAAILLVVFFVAAEPASAALPKTFSQFKARYAKEARTPEGAIKLYFDAVFAFIDSNTRAEGTNMLRYSLRLNKGWEKGPNNQTFVNRMKNPSYEYIFRSFAVGATPENNYSMNKDKYKINIIKKWTGHPSGDLQITLQSGGADSPRAVYLQKEGDLWFMVNNAGTYADVRRPVKGKDKPAYDADFDDENYEEEEEEEEAEEDDPAHIESGSNDIQDAFEKLLLEQLLK